MCASGFPGSISERGGGGQGLQGLQGPFPPDLESNVEDRSSEGSGPAVGVAGHEFLRPLPSSSSSWQQQRGWEDHAFKSAFVPDGRGSWPLYSAGPDLGPR